MRQKRMSSRSLNSATPIAQMEAALAETSAIMGSMAYCDLCDMDREFCEHGLAEKRRNVVATVSRLLISPNGIAHFPGCPHKGDHKDYRRWADLETARAWERLGNGEQLQATGGLSPDLTLGPGAMTASATVHGDLAKEEGAAALIAA